MNTSSSQEFLLGVRDELPILVGVVPFGMIYGILALSAGVDAVAAQAMSAIIFAGSAQFMTVQLAGIGAPAVVMIITGFVINLRHALYSASVAPYVRHLNPAWKGILAYLLTDEAYAVTITHYQREGDQNHQALVFPRRGAGIVDLVAAQHRGGSLSRGAGAGQLGVGVHPGADLHRAGRPSDQGPPQPAGRADRRGGRRARSRAAVQTRPADRRARGDHRRVVERAAMEINIWVLMVVIGALTFLTRLSFIALAGRWDAPPLFSSALRFVPVAILTAIVVPELVMHTGTLDLSLTNPRLLAGLLAILVAWRTRNTVLTIVIGMTLFWVLQAIIK